MGNRRATLLLCLVAFLLGGAFALLVHGPEYFFTSDNSMETAAKAQDRLQHVTGLNYFVQDEWRFPLFDVAHLNAPEGANIIYTDSIPLLAPLARIFYQSTGALPDYFRFWVFLTSCLQGVAAVILVRCAGEHRALPALAAAALFLALPAFLAREGHASLTSHFLLILALAAYAQTARTALFERAWRPFSWLVYGALLIHFYLFVMVWIVYAATLAEGLRRHALRWPRVALELSAHAVVTFGLMILTGYIDFSRDIRAVGGTFGHFSMNLLSPFVPERSGLFGHAPLTLDATGGQYEGYNYLGAGILLILIVSVIAGWRAWPSLLRRHLWISLALTGMTLLALSNAVYAGPVRLFEIPLFEPFGSLLGPLRSSGRFFWPVSYAITLAAILISLRSLRPATFAALALLAVGLQTADSSYFWARNAPAPETEKTRLLHWEYLISLHDHVHLGPEFREVPAHLKDLSLQIQWLASLHDIPVSSAYLARSFSTETAVSDVQMLQSSDPDPRTLYIFLGQRVPVGALKRFARGAHTFALEDSYIVTAQFTDYLIAARRGQIKGAPGGSTLPLAAPESFHVRFNTAVPFDSSAQTDRFTAGLRSAAPGVRENAYDTANLFFQLSEENPNDGPAQLVLRGYPEFRGSIDAFFIEAKLNGTPLGSLQLARDAASAEELRFAIPAAAWAKAPDDQLVELQFRAHPDYEHLAILRRGPPGRWHFEEMEIVAP